MLECRLVHTSLMGSSLTAKVVGGCPQGGVLSHLLWNLVADRLLIATNDLGFSTFGYADDMVILVQGKFVHTVREITSMQEALNVVAKWAVKEDLNINPHKTAIVPFTKRRNLEGLGPEAESVYCVVRTGSLCQTNTVSSLKGYYWVVDELCTLS